MSDRGGANLGTATGRITVDTSQAIGSLNQLGGALTSSRCLRGAIAPIVIRAVQRTRQVPGRPWPRYQESVDAVTPTW